MKQLEVYSIKKNRVSYNFSGEIQSLKKEISAMLRHLLAAPDVTVSGHVALFKRPTPRTHPLD
jgi:hypothetical protein